MPYLQLDTPFTHTPPAKERLVLTMGEIYARHMQADIARISIAIRELGEGNLWRCGPAGPRPAALLMCDIRRGRPAAQRAELARQLVAACTECLGIAEADVNVEFTQHSGDEMYHPLLGGLSADWHEDEAAG